MITRCAKRTNTFPPLTLTYLLGENGDEHVSDPDRGQDEEAPEDSHLQREALLGPHVGEEGAKLGEEVAPGGTVAGRTLLLLLLLEHGLLSKIDYLYFHAKCILVFSHKNKKNLPELMKWKSSCLWVGGSEQKTSHCPKEDLKKNFLKRSYKF